MSDPIQRPWDQAKREAQARYDAQKGEFRREHPAAFKWLWIGGSLLTVLIVVGVIYASSISPGSTKTEPDTIRAWSACKLQMEGHLRSPASAEFPSSLDLDFKSQGKTLRTKAYVDSQNGFGAMIRTTFNCVATDRGNGDFTAVVVIP